MEKHFDFKKSELHMRQLWEEHQIYGTSRDNRPFFSIDTPPPTVSGSLHIGHIFSYTHTDIVARYKRMSGFSVFYPFGFDDNGLPTERFVEKQHNTSAHQIGRSAFIGLCLEETARVEKKFEELWRRVGLSIDWHACYSTIDSPTRAISQASFIDLYKKGFIYRKEEPALYCPQFRTTIAQADLEDVEKETLFSDVIFTTTAGEQLAIGTTRPELLPSCVALFYHPTDTRYKHLAGKHAIVPIFRHEVPILADERVQIEKGTGLVMCCTFGDKTDIEWFKKHQLPYRPSLGLDGRFLPTTGPLAGLKAPEARAAMLDILKQNELILRQRTITHTVSIYERSKKEIEYLMLPQWFLKILPFKNEILAAADTIEWHPPFMKARFIDWVQNLQWDWCLSRQRFFGVPFPIWHDKRTGDIYLPDPKDLPVDPRETHFPGTVPPGVELVPDTDVMDTWNTSSLTPYICKALFEGSHTHLFGDDRRKSSFLPMSMRPQAHDIIRTWAFYTIVKTWMHEGIIPWKDIVISGHVLSGEKEKISKSRGNDPLDPERLLTENPADTIRYWTASGSLGHDIAFSENMLKIGNRLITKLWNACRFAHEHLANVTSKTINKASYPLNCWLINQIKDTFIAYERYFSKYECGLALHAVEHCFWQDFCDNYLELIKPILSKPESFDAQIVSETRATLYWATCRFLQLFSPILPFITETLYQELFRQSMSTISIHQLTFNELRTPESTMEEMEPFLGFLKLVAQSRKLKSDQNISLKTELASCMLVVPDEKLRTFVEKLEPLIKGITNARFIGFTNESAGTSTIEQVDNEWFMTLCLG
ncbi:MAG: valine--tRNA ligase [Candidatus Babeliaceae bacterium]|nr:valine--tRNA ligase [Candidatus Babeliaceae bacterium]